MPVSVPVDSNNDDDNVSLTNIPSSVVIRRVLFHHPEHNDEESERVGGDVDNTTTTPKYIIVQTDLDYQRKIDTLHAECIRKRKQCERLETEIDNLRVRIKNFKT